MKRKEFIRNISLVGVGISLAPTRLFAKSYQQQIKLPTPTVHIPHGNFHSVIEELTPIVNTDVECSITKFSRYGHTESAKDLTVYTFKENGSLLTVFNDSSTQHSCIGKLKSFEFTRKQNGFELVSPQCVIEVQCRNVTVTRTTN